MLHVHGKLKLPLHLPNHTHATALCSIAGAATTRRTLTFPELSPESQLKTLCSSGQLKEALTQMCLTGEDMKFSGYDALLTECIDRRAFREGQRVHAHMIKCRYAPAAYLGTRVIVMYARCGVLGDARKMLEGMTERAVASWTALITGYSQRGCCAEAVALFVEMMRTGALPNKFTLATVLTACAKSIGIEQGMQVHAFVVKSNLIAHMYVGSSLLDMYAKAHKIHEARVIFDEMPGRDVVSCTAIISGYVQLGLNQEALDLFRQLHKEGTNWNYVAFVSLLTAVSGLSALDCGRQVHGLTVRCQLPSCVVLQNSLIDMYSKCGSLTYARRIFDTMPERTVISWNTMLVGYAKHGLGREVIKLFSYMRNRGVKPDNITLMAVLSGCSHGGLVSEGLQFFYSMTAVHGLKPEILHYACVVDLLGRAGKVKKALDILKKMPFEPTPSMWGSLLGACRYHGNVHVAEHAAEKLFQIDPENPTNYVNLSNIYTAAGRWEDAFHVRRLMKAAAMVKDPGRSSIVLDRTMHSFQANDLANPKTLQLQTYARINELYGKEIGYVPHPSCLLHDVDDERKLLGQ